MQLLLRWAGEIKCGRVPCDCQGAGPQMPSGTGHRATAEGLCLRRRVGQGPVPPPWGLAPDAELGRAPCHRRRAGPQTLKGAGPCAPADGLGP